MLTQEENELLTQVGPGTDCGNFLRRYWQPAALSEELSDGGGPLPVRLFGEDFVLFRDEKTGTPGLLDIHCSHRGTDLSYGRLEDGGLRCIYHGWLYDIHGRCLEQPGEPPGKKYHEKIQHPAYPCIECGGAIFTYLGPGDPPVFPNYEFLSVPDDQVIADKHYSESSYLQGFEGNIDSVHLLFVHRQMEADYSNVLPEGNTGWFDVVDVEETDFGLRAYWVRNLDEKRKFVQITSFVMPHLGVFGGDRTDGYSVNWQVAIDDTHHWKYNFTFDRNTPLDKEARRAARTPTDDDYRPIACKENRYLQDRDTMDKLFIGISPQYFQSQDFCVTEGPGPIQDRTREHLGYGDQMIAMARRKLLQAVRKVADGEDPLHLVREDSMNNFPGVSARRVIIPIEADHRSALDEGDRVPPVFRPMQT